MSTSNDYPSVEVAAPPPDKALLYRQFPVACLHEPMRSFVVAGSSGMRIDPAFFALPALATLAGVVGNGARAVVHGVPNEGGCWSEPGVLWLALVGESGSGKTPAMEEATKPLWNLHFQNKRRLAAALEQYDQDETAYDKQLAAWRKAGGSVDDPMNPPPMPPEEPAETQAIIDDTTIEALIPILKNTPRGPATHLRPVRRLERDRRHPARPYGRSVHSPTAGRGLAWANASRRTALPA